MEVLVNADESCKQSLLHELETGEGNITVNRLITMWKWQKMDLIRKESEAMAAVEAFKVESEKQSELHQVMAAEAPDADDEDLQSFDSMVEADAVSPVMPVALPQEQQHAESIDSSPELEIVYPGENFKI